MLDSTSHLRSLSDARGLSEFANGFLPMKDRFCIEDTARALVAVLKMHTFEPTEETGSLARLYLEGIAGLQDHEGRFHFGYKGNEGPMPLMAEGDNFTRVLWGLGHASAFGVDGLMKARATAMFEKARAHWNPASPNFIAQTYAIQGFNLFLQAHPAHKAVKKSLSECADNLLNLLPQDPMNSWSWPQKVVTYDSARLPLSLLLSYKTSGDDRYLTAGKRTLEFLLRINFPGDGMMLHVIGNEGWYEAGGNNSKFCQQPIDASSMVEGCVTAWHITRDERYRKYAVTAFSWFTGNNMGKSLLYDAASGSCRDGLGENGTNPNRGGEATVSYLIASCEIQSID